MKISNQILRIRYFLVVIVSLLADFSLLGKSVVSFDMSNKISIERDLEKNSENPNKPGHYCAVLEIELHDENVSFMGECIESKPYYIKKRGVYRLLIDPEKITSYPTITLSHPNALENQILQLVDDEGNKLRAKARYSLQLNWKNIDVCDNCGKCPCACCEKCHSYPCKCKKIKKKKKKKKVESEKEEEKDEKEMKWYEVVFYTIADVARKIYGAISKAIAFLLSLIF